MALDMDLAKRLKTYRTFKNLTQKEVAHILMYLILQFQILKMVKEM